MLCDADVTLSPGALSAARHQIRAQRAEVFSVFPRQCTLTWGERLLVPVIDETLLGFLPHPPPGGPAAATANGRLPAFHRAAYHRLGGHTAVAGAPAEDVVLARRARAHGLKLGLAPGGNLVTARMYGGYRDPGVWPDPVRFAPGRPRTAWGYLPFAVGGGTCLGAHLGRLMLRTALKACRPRGLTQVSGNRFPRTGITLRPGGPLWLEHR